jgi:hypothetical protein
MILSALETKEGLTVVDRTSLDALDALAEVRAARAAVARRLPIHWTIDLAFALAVGGVFAVNAMPMPWGPLAAGPCIGAITWLSVIRRDRSGIWAKNGGPPPARAVTIGMYLIIAALALITFISSMALGQRWPALIAGGVATVTTFVASRWWVSIYRKALAASGI